MGAYGRLLTAKMVAMHPKQGMLRRFFTHSVLNGTLPKLEGTYVTSMRTEIPICRTNRLVDEEI